MNKAPKPGDFFVTSNGPLDSTLRGSLLANAIQWGTNSTFNHAGLCIDHTTVVEAQPGGAQRTHINGYLGPNTMWSKMPLTDEQRTAAAVAAASLVGVPYGWSDYLAITLAQKRLGKWQRVNAELPMEKQPWWVRRLGRTDRLICSELVDFALFLAGIHLYDDGRPFGLVSPGDLGRLIEQGS
jgi:hypothetical protein